MKKKIDTLIEDIYGLLEQGTNVNSIKHRDAIQNFGRVVAAATSSALSEGKRERSKNLRMSQIGKPNRQLWYDMNAAEGKEETINGPTRLKFLYGEILEALLVLLTEVSGHEVTEQQKTVEVAGIKGHKDCRIDGTLVDIKSASPYAFKKFKEGTLSLNDPFGYIAQISGYAEAEGDNTAAFFAVDKSSGELALMTVDQMNMINASDRINYLKGVLKQATPPERCYEAEPDGKSGNMKLAVGCIYCPHKFECWKDANGGHGLRQFQYSTGVRYLTQVVNPPAVEEIHA
tara:strand:- start:1116 stop:1979 length:864 start_codon:yes stop_codon:yes gene_type:complete